MRKGFIILFLITCLLVFSSGCISPQQADGPNQTTQSVILYFANQDATKMIGESRYLTNVPDQEQFLKLVLEELIKGPENEGLSKTIPETVKVQVLTIENGLVHVDFSQDMHTDHWRGSTGEIMTVQSIVLTLTEFPFIEKVKMTVGGETMDLGHMSLDEPISRNEI